MNIELTYSDQVKQVQIPANVIFPVIPPPGYPDFAEETWGDQLELVREAKTNTPSFKLTKHGGLILFNLQRDLQDTTTFTCIGEAMCIHIDEEKGTIQTLYHEDVKMTISLVYQSSDCELSVCSVGESPWWDGVTIDVGIHAEHANKLKLALEKSFCQERVAYYKPDNCVFNGGEHFLIPDAVSSETVKAGKYHIVALRTPLGHVNLRVASDSEYALLLAPNDDPYTQARVEYLPCSIPMYQMTHRTTFRLDATRMPASKSLFLLSDFCLITQHELSPITDCAGRSVESFTARAQYVGVSPSEKNFYYFAQQEDLSLNVLSTRCVYGRIFRPHATSAQVAPKGFVIMIMEFPGVTMGLSFPIDTEKFMKTLRVVPVPRMIECHHGVFGRSRAAEEARELLRDTSAEGVQSLFYHYKYNNSDVKERQFIDPSVSDSDKKEKDHGNK